MQKLLKSFWTPDEHGERPAVLFLTAAAGFGSTLEPLRKTTCSSWVR